MLLPASPTESTTTSAQLLEHLAANLSAGLRRAARRQTGDRAAADDLVQDALIAVWKKMQSDRAATPERLTALARAVVRNRACNLRRSRRSRREVGDTDALLTVAEVSGWASEDEPMQDLELAVTAALLRLRNPTCAEAMRQFLNGVSYVQIAEKLGAKVATVRSWISRARAALAQDPKLNEHPAVSRFRSAQPSPPLRPVTRRRSERLGG